MSNLRSTLVMMSFVVLACGSASDATPLIDGPKGISASLVPTPLRSASGKLKHVFSIPFEADPVTLSKVSGLESLTFARTSASSGINIVLDYGVPHPTKAISVRIVENVGVDANEVIDPLQPPSAMPSRSGQRLISTFRVPGKNSYLAAWMDMRSGESSLTVWDEDDKAGQPILVATSSSQILGAAVQPSMHGIPELTIMVWTRGRNAGDAVAGLYSWDRS